MHTLGIVIFLKFIEIDPKIMGVAERHEIEKLPLDGTDQRSINGYDNGTYGIVLTSATLSYSYCAFASVKPVFVISTSR